MKIILGKRKETDSNENTDLYLLLGLIAGLLFLRDWGQIPVNKYILLMLVGIPALLMPLRKTLYLMCFVMPLYVGLPGNYLTLIFLLKYFLVGKQVKLNGYNLLFCILAGGYVFLQSYATNHLAIAELVFFPSLVLVMFMYACRIPYDKKQILLCYAAGVTALGLIMLLSTLRVYGFEDLLTSATRLGDDSMRFAEAGIMNVSIDPNFYGMFAIAAIATGCSALLQNQSDFTKPEKILLAVMIASCAAVGLLGLSRGFLLILLIWAVFFTFSSNNIKTFATILLLGLLAVVAVFVFMPSVIESLLERFAEDNFSTGGGRLTLIERYTALWGASLGTILFGIGLWDCNVHCMPLQPLFGGGILLFVSMLGFVLTLSRKQNSVIRKGSFVQRWLPLGCTVLMSMTVPAFMLFNFAFPVVFEGLYMKQEKTLCDLLEES